jgi:hypothetical protein
MGFDRITPVLTLAEMAAYVTELKHSFTSCMGSMVGVLPILGLACVEVI